jgi:putative ABC transport system permease protein
MRHPPTVWRRLLAVRLGRDPVARSVLGDLDEEFADLAAVDDRSARRWYRREVAGVLLRARTIAPPRVGAGRRERRTGDPMIRTLMTDLRDALRVLRKQPRFTIISSLTLALGIGAVTSIFSVVNGVLLRPLPYPAADRIVNLWSNAEGLGYDQFPLSPDLYFFYRNHNDIFEDIGILQAGRGSLTDGETPENISMTSASWSYFSTIGARFSQGRPYTAEEDLPDATPVAVVSHRFWTRLRGSDPDLVGKTIRLDGVQRVVVGIAPAWLDAPQSTDVWIPAGFDPEAPPTGDFGWNVVARLKPGIDADQAAAHLVPLVQRAMEEMVDGENYRAFLTEGRYRPLVHLASEDLVGNLRRPLWVLLGTVGMVLLIACANVANLCLIRAEGRQREIAVRSALGGNRAGLVRKMLVEAMVIASAGTALGLGVSAVGMPVLLRMAPPSIPRLDQVSIDPLVVAFTVGVVLRQGGRGGTEGPARRRGRNVLVVGQTALALILLVGSGLLGRSFTQLMALDPGFEPEGVLSFRVDLDAADYPDVSRVIQLDHDVIDRLRGLPGATASGAASVLPIASGSPGSAHDIADRPTEPGQLPPIVHFVLVTTGFFETMGMEIRSGRDFDATDRLEDVQTVVVNTAFAEQYWPGEDPIGKQLRPTPAPDTEAGWYSVVGVVETVRQDGLRNPVRPLVYYPLNPTTAVGGSRTMSFVVRSANPDSLRESVRREVWAIDGTRPVANVRTMAEVVETSVVQFTFTMVTLGIAAVMALVLGAIGLYGVLSYAVSLRTREIGVRMALGAQPGAVMRSVVASGAALTMVGLAVGLAGAAGLTRFLQGILFETEPLDPATFAVMPAALLFVGLLASFLPARRAALVSPLESMRED